MLASAFKIIGASILAFAVIWALVLGWWQANDHTPSTSELLLYLGALPVAVIGGYWLLRGFIEHVKAPPPAPVAAPLDTSDPLASEAARTASRERGYTVGMIGASVLCGAGGSLELLEALAADKRPTPDAQLLDDDGFPVFAARAEALDVDDIGERLREHDAVLADALGNADEPLRMLALIDAALPPALAQAREQMVQGGPDAHLHLLWLLPAGIDASLIGRLQAWLGAQYLADIDPARLTLRLRHTPTEAAALQELDALVLATRGDPSPPDVSLVLAAASAIGSATVQAWAARQALFSATQQNAAIPGECAVCLVFGDAPASDPQVRLSRISQGERDKSIVAAGRVSGALTEQLIAGLLTIHDLEASSIQAVVSDADHCQRRGTELFDALGEAFEAIVPGESAHQVATACGYAPPFGALLALACAWEKSVASMQPVLAISQQHPTARAAALLLPAPVPPDASSVAT
ncbi:hypothetical protein [Denitromonas iodatirespirans]|uniref:Uncharacterized protein n=1 Tax=Denitromonas iodatirespirans TaxID=2795389 RepID=A0A944D5B4_DENI1|nr:hypothetical protein [Denitromonas iodatirespirans]MBT0960209.1 hypothetical protein [Denitromonas iodatirespirans]